MAPKIPPDMKRMLIVNFTTGRYDLAAPPAKREIVRRVQDILRTDFRRDLTPKQVQMLWSDLKRRDQDLLRRITEEIRSGNAAPQARGPGPQPRRRGLRPRPVAASSRSSSPPSPGPSHHSQRMHAASHQCVSLATHLRMRQEMRMEVARLATRLRRQERGVRILQQQVLELRERSARQAEEIAQLRGTGGRRDA